MAIGILSSPTISSNGKEIAFTVTGGAWAGSITVDPTKCTVSITSEGYSGTTLGTVARTTTISEATYSGGTITALLADPVHDDDTSITVACAAGLFDDGTDSSDTLGSTATTNNSTLDYPTPVVLVASEVLCKITGDFYVDVYAVGAAYNGLETNWGLQRVEVDVTDNASGAGATVTKTSSAPEMVPAMDPTNGAYSEVLLWRVGPFDIDDPGDWTGGATQDLASIVARAYPTVGDASTVVAGVSPTEYVFLDKDDNFEVRHAVVDPTSGDDGTGRIASGDGGYSLGVDSVSVTASSSPYQSHHAAVSDLQRGDGTLPATAHGTPSFSVVYLVEDTHTIGTYSFGARSNTSLGPVILTKLPSAIKANVIVDDSDAGGLRTVAWTLDDVSWQPGASGTISSSAPADGTGGPLGPDNRLVIKDVDYSGLGRGVVMSNTPTDGFEVLYRYGGTVKNADRATAGSRICRDVTYDNISGDAQSLDDISDYLILNNAYTNFDPDGTLTHVDIVQFNGATNNALSNIGYHACTITRINKVQAPIFGNAGGLIMTVDRFAMTQIISESDGQATHAQLADWDVDSLFFYHNSLEDALSYRDNSSNFAWDNAFIKRNAFANQSLINSPDTRGLHIADCHNRTGTFTQGIGYSTGSSTAEMYADWGTDWSPLSSGPLVSRYSVDMAPFDPVGNVYDSQEIGALAVTGALPPPSETITNPPDTQATQAALDSIKADCDTLNALGVGTSVITASNLASQDYEAAFATQKTNQDNLNTDNSLGLTLTALPGTFEGNMTALYNNLVAIEAALS